MEAGFSVEAVLDDQVYRDVELGRLKHIIIISGELLCNCTNPAACMLCAEIHDKKQTSEIIRYALEDGYRRSERTRFMSDRVLSVQFPLPEFTHLKRVKGGPST